MTRRAADKDPWAFVIEEELGERWCSECSKVHELLDLVVARRQGDGEWPMSEELAWRCSGWGNYSAWLPDQRNGNRRVPPRPSLEQLELEWSRWGSW